MRHIATNPVKVSENLTKIIDTLEEMATRGVITEEQKNKHIQRIYREMQAPEEFKAWLKSKFGFIRNRLDRAKAKAMAKKEALDRERAKNKEDPSP